MNEKLKLNGSIISAVLKQNRIKAGKLAQNLGISKSHLSRLLNGERLVGVFLVLKLSRLFNADPRLFVLNKNISFGRRKLKSLTSGPAKHGPTSHKKKGKK